MRVVDNDFNLIEEDNDEEVDKNFNPSECEPLSFICGSQEELERLTKIICYSDPSLFSRSDEIYIGYEAGKGLDKENCRTPKWDFIEFNSKTETLLNLAYEHNSFNGYYWEYNDGAYDRTGYDQMNEYIRLDLTKPNAHTVLWAQTKLVEWAKEVLPKEEYNKYFDTVTP